MNTWILPGWITITACGAALFLIALTTPGARAPVPDREVDARGR